MSELPSRASSLKTWLAAFAVLCVGCEGVSITLPFDEADLTAVESAYMLRYKRVAGSADRYQSTYKIRVRTDPQKAGYISTRASGYEIDEDITADLIIYHMGKTEDDPPFDRVVFRRRDEKRKRLEVLEGGRVRQDAKKKSLQPRITPNFAPEPSLKNSSIVYVPMNELGCIPRSKSFPYHYAWDDSLCYMFPVFPRGEVRVGDTWNYKFPAIIGMAYANNEVTINCEFRLSDVRRMVAAGGKEGPVCAVIDYTYHGLIDSSVSKNIPKIPDSAPGLLWRREAVEGEGKAYFDIERGKVLWRKESYNIYVDRDTRQPVRKKEVSYKFMPKKKKKKEPPKLEVVEYRARISVDFGARLLGLGERASDRPSRVDD